MEPQAQIEYRTFVGQLGTKAVDGFAGFRLRESYQLCFTRRANGTVAVALGHAWPGGNSGPLVVSKEQFERWWVKRA